MAKYASVLFKLLFATLRRERNLHTAQSSPSLDFSLASPAFGCAINKEVLEQRSSQICLCISWCPYKEKIRAEAIEARAKYEKVESTYLNIC